MVKETRIVITPGDVLGVRIKCPRCKNSIVLRLDNEDAAIRDQCPLCSYQWNQRSGDRQAVDVARVECLLSDLRRLAQDDATYVELEFRDTDAK